ncbi:hypothetical protein [Halorubrum sp. SP9]|uniref:hypothetical protein n=1 Tax=Halorubrum sp. SP9 TaxID=1537267 RepID=UPI0010F9FD39|nr:hypothetical protein [Halorubrum sp. SP9]TKX66486.1 hypothetical protein EXE45_15285 [Halorubrum sp. SP9]
MSKSAVIADDDETIRSILQYKLSNAGYEPTVCHDGEECRQALNGTAAASYAPADGTADGGTARPLDAATNLTHAVPGGSDGALRSLEFVPPTWDRPAYTERLKESADAVADVFDRYARRGD